MMPQISNFLFIIYLGLSSTLAQRNHPICIIGAGPAGLYSAISLHDLGYETVVFEKESDVGGRVRTIEIFGKEPKIVELGAVLFDPTSKPLKQIAARFNANLTEIPTSSPLWKMNAYNKEGLRLPFGAASKLIPVNVRDGLNQYFRIRKLYPEIYNYDSSHYKNVHPDLSMPFSKFLNHHNMSQVLPMFYLAITCEGYGSLAETPALYVLRLVDQRVANLLIFRTENSVIFGNGYQNLWRSVAANLRDLRLNVKIKKINRISKNLQTVHYALANGQNYQQDCQKVIIAFPQLLHRLQAIMDLSKKEYKLFAKVMQEKYFSSILKSETLDAQFYSGILKSTYTIFMNLLYGGSYNLIDDVTEEPEGGGEVILIAQQSPGITSAYSWLRGPSMSISNEEETLVYNKLSETWKNAVGYLKTPEIIQFKSWDYFPHLNSEDIENQWYDQADLLQGFKGTYYTGALFDFDSVGGALRAAHELIQRYFSYNN